MITSRRWFRKLSLLDVAKAWCREFAGNDVAIRIARVILYCETVFVIIEYRAHQPIVKRPSGPRALFAGEVDAGAYGLIVIASEAISRHKQTCRRPA
jgi:hypothetical protein